MTHLLELWLFKMNNKLVREGFVMPKDGLLGSFTESIEGQIVVETDCGLFYSLKKPTQTLNETPKIRAFIDKVIASKEGINPEHWDSLTPEWVVDSPAYQAHKRLGALVQASPVDITSKTYMVTSQSELDNLCSAISQTIGDELSDRQPMHDYYYIRSDNDGTILIRPEIDISGVDGCLSFIKEALANYATRIIFDYSDPIECINGSYIINFLSEGIQVTETHENVLSKN